MEYSNSPSKKDEEMCQKLADQAMAEMDRHLKIKTPENTQVDTAKWALDGMRRPQVLHHFRIMRLSTSNAKNPDEAFYKLLREMATFCSAAGNHPGLGEVLSGICENVFDPTLDDIKHLDKVLSLAAGDWASLPRETTRNDLPPHHIAADINQSDPPTGKDNSTGTTAAGNNTNTTKETILDTPVDAAANTAAGTSAQTIGDAPPQTTIDSCLGKSLEAGVTAGISTDPDELALDHMNLDSGFDIDATPAAENDDDDANNNAKGTDATPAAENDDDDVNNNANGISTDPDELAPDHMNLDSDFDIDATLAAENDDDAASDSTYDAGATFTDDDDDDAANDSTDGADATPAADDGDDAASDNTDGTELIGGTVECEMDDTTDQLDKYVPVTATFSASNEFDISSMQILGRKMKFALREKRFPYRYRNRERLGNIPEGDDDKVINFIFYNLSRLPALLQRVLQQLHAVESQEVADINLTLEDDSVPSIVRDFAASWLERLKLEERSALFNMRRVSNVVSLQWLFEGFCDGLMGRGREVDIEWQQWAKNRSSFSGSDPTHDEPSDEQYPGQRGTGWSTLAKRAIMIELNISNHDWTKASREWPFITPFVDAFGIGAILFFAAEDKRYSIKSIRYTSMLPGIVNIIKVVDEEHGEPIGRMLEMVGDGVVEKIIDAMGTADENECRTRIGHVVQPLKDESLLIGKGSVCERLQLFGLTH